MPLPSKPRAIPAGEGNLRRRITLHRQERGQSYDALAKLMTDVGCPIKGWAISRIEKGDPPRGVSVDELVALSTVWEIPVAELLMPIELWNQQRGQELATHLAEAERDLCRSLELLYDTAIELDSISDELAEYVLNYRNTLFRGSPGINGEWQSKAPLWAWHKQVWRLLPEVIELHRDERRVTEAGLTNENGMLLDPETGEIWASRPFPRPDGDE